MTRLGALLLGGRLAARLGLRSVVASEEGGESGASSGQPEDTPDDAPGNPEAVVLEVEEQPLAEGPSLKAFGSAVPPLPPDADDQASGFASTERDAADELGQVKTPRIDWVAGRGGLDCSGGAELSYQETETSALDISITMLTAEDPSGLAPLVDCAPPPTPQLLMWLHSPKPSWAERR